jgi:hypothetical protein
VADATPIIGQDEEESHWFMLTWSVARLVCSVFVHIDTHARAYTARRRSRNNGRALAAACGGRWTPCKTRISPPSLSARARRGDDRARGSRSSRTLAAPMGIFFATGPAGWSAYVWRDVAKDAAGRCETAGGCRMLIDRGSLDSWLEHISC